MRDNRHEERQGRGHNPWGLAWGLPPACHLWGTRRKKQEPGGSFLERRGKSFHESSSWTRGTWLPLASHLPERAGEHRLRTIFIFGAPRRSHALESYP